MSGSSVGCYRVTNKDELTHAVNEAFTYSDQVLIEKAIKPRELEIAAYQYGDELVITKPGEVSCQMTSSTATKKSTVRQVYQPLWLRRAM
ncbi:D-alanine-D-alanine ligase [Photobacterium aphoticum]|uniref:D-alanine-D-alanine ligase n=1 Tax=Photobacterium aphoticum TaxID=754436 RepID=A0A090QL72_9GAMM|nr:D-alanine-D-alanine ligase [Photobacterium aphoticum]